MIVLKSVVWSAQRIMKSENHQTLSKFSFLKSYIFIFQRMHVLSFVAKYRKRVLMFDGRTAMMDV